MSGLARIKFRNDYVDQQREASWYNVIEVQELLMLVCAI